MGGPELQLGQGLIAGAGLADAQTAGSVELQLGVLLAVLGILHQVLRADIHLGDVRDAAVLDVRGLAGLGTGGLNSGSGGAAHVHLAEYLLNDCSQIFLIH